VNLGFQDNGPLEGTPQCENIPQTIVGKFMRRDGVEKTEFDLTRKQTLL